MERKTRNPKRAGWLARRARTKKKLGRSPRVRLVVYRSLKHTYAQLLDGEGKTLGGVSTRTPALSLEGTGNVAAARKVGEAIAALAREKQIEEVVFNRNGYLFHGRIKAVADAAREAGLRF